MVKNDHQAKTHFRIVLRACREDVNGKLRRPAKGFAYVNIREQYGEVLLTVENLKYLGTAPNGLPFYYEGWMILANGFKISMGPVSTDEKGNGKGYWRFSTYNAENTGIKTGDIAGFAVIVETVNGNSYPSDLVVLMGAVNKKIVAPGLQVAPDGINRANTGAQWPTGTTGIKEREEGYTPASLEHIPYSWWPVQVPGIRTKTAPLLFGYHLHDSGVERVAFGFPGSPDRPVLTGEVGEWRPTGTNNPYGYWVYHREPQ